MNKKGFALIEILTVTVVVMVIFTLLYSNLFPLIGEYEKRVGYTDVESQYISFYMRKLYKDKAIDLGGSNYKVLYQNTSKSCALLSGSEKTKCEAIAEASGIVTMIVTNKDLTSLKESNLLAYSDLNEIVDYIKYLPKYTNSDPVENYRLIIKTSTGYATTELKTSSTLVTSTTRGLSTEKFTNAISTYKSNILRGYTLTNTSVPATATFSADVSGAGDGSVKVWLVPNSSDSTKYDMYIGANGKKVILDPNSKELFSNFSIMTSLDLSNVDTSDVTDMNLMFRGLSKITSLNLSSFDTSNVTDMGWMFAFNQELTSLNLSSFDTSNVTNMGFMFYFCSKLTNLNVSNFNTSKVTSMTFMFHNNKSITSLNLSNFDTKNVKNMSAMFNSMSNLTSLNISSFDTSNVTDMGSMFAYLDSLPSLDLRHFNTSKVTDMSTMFFESDGITSLNVSSFDTRNVTNMGSMFAALRGITTLNLSNFNTSKVTDMSYMFAFNTALTSINVTSFDTSNVTNMDTMFFDCNKLTTLDVSSFNTAKVTNMKMMFTYTSSVSKIYANSAKWNTTNADTTDMFKGSAVSAVTYK